MYCFMEHCILLKYYLRIKTLGLQIGGLEDDFVESVVTHFLDLIGRKLYKDNSFRHAIWRSDNTEYSK